VFKASFRWIAMAMALAVALVAVGCSRSTDLGSEDVSSTTVRHSATTDPLDAQALATGKQAVNKLQGIVDSMLASNDTCAILTQKDVPKNQLDPSLLTS
jgi:PBP1b-binding outer membrane lipoprotein LpoB